MLVVDLFQGIFLDLEYRNTVFVRSASGGAGGLDSATGRMLLSMLSQYLPYLPQIANLQVVTETGALVGQLAPQMDQRLGVISYRQRRQ